MKSRPKRRSIGGLIAIAGLFACMAAASLMSGLFSGGSAKQTLSLQPQKKHPASLSLDLRPTSPRAGDFSPRLILDTSGFSQINAFVRPWSGRESLDEISKAWKSIGYRSIETIDQTIKPQIRDAQRSVFLLVDKAMLYNSEGQPQKALEVLEEAKAHCSKNPELAKLALYTLIYLQGVSAIRLGENENCVMCRGESSCILPISEAATHRVPRGSQLAIERFTEYLDVFPNDIEVRWLLNLAHMTLGQYPDKVDPRYLITLDRYMHPEFDIGKFRDVGHLTGVNRFSQAGGSIMDDFDNDGRLDLVVTAYDPTESIVYYHNTGDGTFEDRTSSAGIQDQLGGLFCTQVDYDNDGDLDIWISRGAWLKQPIRPSLLSNNGDGTFKDVTEAAGLSAPVNSNSAGWTDYDNDGHLDLFVCCEQQPSKLYHNNGNGTFEEVATKAGFWAESQPWNKGAAWIDYDNDDYPDLYLNHLSGFGRLYHNNKNGTFSEVTGTPVMPAGAQNGFSCWAWDYNNDGFLDLFATSYRFSTDEIIRGLVDGTQAGSTSRLLRNYNGERFEDVSIPAGLNLAYGCMGSNFADFDNDGFLDFYLGTGEPNFATLIPNRMFKNVAGGRFSEITMSAGVGHLQKGHGIACGDWDRDGDVDLFAQMGGAVNGDKYHDILFQNPGQGNNQLTVKLVGTKSNRSAIGARIKMVVAAEKDPLTVHRHISAGSSFGSNTLEQTLGMGKADRVATLEIHWPTSGATQVFHDIPANRAIEITEFASEFKTIEHTPITIKE